MIIANPEGQVLMGKRKSDHGRGSWGLPGGKLEYGESFEQAAIRETFEETGLTVKINAKQIAGVTNDFFVESGKHYITVFMLASSWAGEPQLMEPDKCAE